MTSSARSRPKWMVPLAVLVKSSKLLKVVKTAKILKPLLTATSAFASVVVYAFGFGWWVSLGLVSMLAIHEFGHVWAFRRKGMKVSLPLFIPMLGAVVFAPAMGRRDDEAYCGIAGPVVGTLGALPVIAVALAWPGSPEVVLLIAYIAVVLNLFNLIPLSPLDGGRVTQAVGPWFRWVGAALLLALTVLLVNPGMLLIWILVLGDFRMPLTLRAALGGALWALMLALMLAGLGEQPWPIDVVDLLVGGLYAGLYVVMAKFRSDPFAEADQRPQLAPYQRWSWLGAYAGMVTALSLLLFVLYAHLPEGAR